MAERIVLTVCTARKSRTPHPLLVASDLLPGTQDDVTRQWLQRVAAVPADEFLPAGSLYCGRGFSLAHQAAEELRASLYIISAGFGLLSASSRVPAYDLTLDSGRRSSLKRRIASQHLDPARWWHDINPSTAGRPLHRLLTRHSAASVLVNVSEPYLQLIWAELDALPQRTLRRVRIIGPRPRAVARASWRDVVMPYDERLDGPDSPLRGTRSDFAQRALAHFAAHALAEEPDAPPSEHARCVRDTLAGWRPPPDVTRPRLGDEELLAWIEQHWADEHGHSSRLLRRLRHAAGFACEQGRFAALCRQVAERLDA